MLILILFTSLSLQADELKNVDLDKIELEASNQEQTQVKPENEPKDLEIEDLEKIYFKHNELLKNSKRRVRSR